jgi:hypothetical protein
MQKPLSSLKRLVLRQHQDNRICIYSGHAKDVLGNSDLVGLVNLINEGIDKGLLERCPDDGQTPETLDARKHKDWYIGLRLTEAGKRRAKKWEKQHGAFCPWAP